MDDSQTIRMNFLRVLYEASDENPSNPLVKRKVLKNKLKVEDNLLDSNAKYLEDSGYIECIIPMGGNFVLANITSKGKDFFDNSGSLQPKVVQNIVSGGQGIFVGDGSTVNFDISGSFNRIYGEIGSKNPARKDEIKKVVMEIEDELKKEKIDTSKIKKALGFLKNNASWIVPEITRLISSFFLSN